MRDLDHIRLWDGDLCICVLLFETVFVAKQLIVDLFYTQLNWPIVDGGHKWVVFLIQSIKKINQVIFP